VRAIDTLDGALRFDAIADREISRDARHGEAAKRRGDQAGELRE